jgi:transcriptional regulator with XRE-family HTH domain
MAIKVIRQHLTLPSEVADTFASITDKRVRNAYIVKLRKAGWTLASIGEVAGMTREAVRQKLRGRKLNESLADGLPVPSLPFVEVPDKEPRTFIEPDPIDLARMLELQPLAQQVRSNSPLYRKEAEEYTWLLHKAHNLDGVTLYRLALRLGVTHAGIRFRLARYGYKAPKTATSRVYGAILEQNRVKL